MKEIIRCAVLGLGRLGYWHAENLRHKIKGAELVYVIDPAKGRAEQVARELGVEKWSQYPDDAFHDESIDAVVIVTPTSTHADMITRAAIAGKQIFVEKPITQTLEEADKVISVIQKQQVVCQVGFMRRFDPAYAEARRRIVAGDIGKPLYFKGTSRDGNVPHEAFIKHSGGLFLDVAIHDYDIARFLMDQEVRTITASGKILLEENQFMAKYNDIDQGFSYFTFAKGASGDIETMRIAPYGYDIRGEVVGTEGAIQIGSMRSTDVKLLNNNGSTHDLIQDFPSRFQDAYFLEMVHFIEALQKGETPSCTEIDGKAALEIALAATESLVTGKTVTLDGEISKV
ncbi:Gfo/Idh/MocA family oxidoreductase [Virgibacillus pantothenticus]|uniref:Gfo/Idh/MocA family oxidoreductase n=1 Tax=Virgibacillus pantothenticus TaxID=1473 RepID=UPI001C2230CD|nr:Gfo/Idh/MocA family oxidoreductase [Virgibacillus pantothenticus]MBU8568545.1 Gfo/Idh/MocA family oxidoreductase [Virgibacillus pantothenticus]MBU8602484.1 Gfo/Idh/MocA family oxidoreductase [Virgibacillus pantothenticus]MBU8636667.1 Gfo/Idh/MocA family oxidoreductase [Virgibacillus pantothenticus]MBU8644355.1 Gfo/Idh/MocA family oxidoreductase [Virgibacillus pantothenticus]MBU8648485.1 Gfo/Idh/MocA family oxidoreductase [Virgibacillus pantothenticus]